MVLLEAQATGCPVVAGAFGGVADAMRPGVTGLMPPAGDARAFADDVATLVADPERRVAMGVAAGRFVQTERNLGRAADILGAALRPMIAAAVAA
jgi:glycosyltransferase involved in cell wall biosynthesis